MRPPKCLSAIAALAVAGSLALGVSAAPAFAGTKPVIPACHNDTHLPNNFVNGSKFGGDPNVGLKPLGGYYYLDLTACATTVTFTLDTTPGCWNFQMFDGPDHNSPRLVHFKVMHPFTFTLTNTVPGHIYSARVDNLESFVVTDHSSINSP